MQKCMYCGVKISDDCVLTVCHKCGERVWGERMFNVIIKNMEDARERGDLCHTNNISEFSKKTESVENFKEDNSFSFR